MRATGFMAVLLMALVAGVADAEVTWEQLPGGDPALWSAADQCDAWTALAADDFYCEVAGPVTGLEWWGKHVVPACPTPQSFVIRFYSDVPDPDPFSPTDWSHPGNILYEEECLFFTEVAEPQYQGNHYYLQLMTPFEQAEDTVYWLSIQAMVCMPEVGWAWLECDPSGYWNGEAVWTSDNSTPSWYVPDWTPPSVYTEGIYYTELSFRLISEPATPVEMSSWGRLKALYR